MCCKRYHIIFSTFSLKFKCKICVQKEVIQNFKNHILVAWPATNLLILRKINGTGLKNQITIILFKIWPTIRFSKAKSYNFHFHKNDVTWPLSANGLWMQSLRRSPVRGQRKRSNEWVNQKKNHSMSNWRWDESLNWSKLQKNSLLLITRAVLQCLVREIYALRFKQQFKQIVSKRSIMHK